MTLLSLSDVGIGFGGPPVLDGASFQIGEGERIGLVGRNGSGKSTLLNLLCGSVAPDRGTVGRGADVRVSLLPQDVPDDLPGTVYDVVASGGARHIELLTEYHDLAMRVGREGGEGLLREFSRVQHRLESSGAWHHHRHVETVIDRTSLDGGAEFRALSAGLKRRVFLARALAGDPDVLLLDEPTNHLDIGSILWLEEFLLGYDRAIVFVTHDREFLRRLATRIVEVDRGKTASYACDNRTYLARRESMREAEEHQWQEFDRKLQEEEAWIRRGVRARRTRNEGRVRALVEMRAERAQRREQAGSVRLAIPQAEASGRLVAEARDVCFAYGDKTIIEGFSTTIIRGDKVGIIGPNGSGKTTLIRVLLGELAPQRGTIRYGVRLEIAYFDQVRAQLDDALTLKENISGANETVVVGGVARNITGYLQDFLFTRAQVFSPVKKLSGGERNRLLLAKMFSAPSNVLVLDEPTNDLDTETLELLEDRILEYAGTVLMVSHDRAFLNEVVTSTIAFEGGGRLQEYVGGYDDWLRQRPAAPEPPKAAPRTPAPKRQRGKTKLNFKEQRELDGLPGIIEGLEVEKRGLVGKLNSPAFQTGSDLQAIRAASDRLEEVERELDRAMHRWNELEELSAAYESGA